MPSRVAGQHPNQLQVPLNSRRDIFHYGNRAIRHSNTKIRSCCVLFVTESEIHRPELLKRSRPATSYARHGGRVKLKIRKSVNICVVVGDVADGGQMLRFTSKCAYIYMSNKPFHMSRNSLHTPHVSLRSDMTDTCCIQGIGLMSLHPLQRAREFAPILRVGSEQAPNNSTSSQTYVEDVGFFSNKYIHMLARKGATYRCHYQA